MSDQPQPPEADNMYLAYIRALNRAEADGCSLIEAEEQGIRAVLAWLQQDYQRQAQPWLKRLCDIEARKPMRDGKLLGTGHA